MTEVSPQHRRRSTILEGMPKNKVGVEVGSWKGDFAAELLRMTEPKTLHLVDPWASAPDKPDEWYSVPQDEMDGIYRSVAARFADDDRVKVHRKPSVVASRTFKARSLDWVYIDGDHSYEGVLGDLRAWYPKVKSGGILCGDDYDDQHYWGDGVLRAVADFRAEQDIEQIDIGQDQFWLVK